MEELFAHVSDLNRRLRTDWSEFARRGLRVRFSSSPQVPKVCNALINNIAISVSPALWDQLPGAPSAKDHLWCHERRHDASHMARKGLQHLSKRPEISTWALTVNPILAGAAFK